MSCKCANNLNDTEAINNNKVVVPPKGIKAVWEEFKIPICVSGIAISGMILYEKFGNKKKKALFQ